MPKWNYSGDVNLEYGGFFWKEDGQEDYVLAVRVTPCSDAGGPDNLFCIEIGSIYLPNDERRKAALACIGSGDNDAPTRAELAYAFLAYCGMDIDETWVVRIGRAEECSAAGWNPEPDIVLRGNARLDRFVKREFLRG